MEHWCISPGPSQTLLRPSLDTPPPHPPQLPYPHEHPNTLFPHNSPPLCSQPPRRGLFFFTFSPPCAVNSVLLLCRGISRGRCRCMPPRCPGLQTILPTGRVWYHSRGHPKAPPCYLSFVLLSPIWAGRLPTFKTYSDETSVTGFNTDENRHDFRKGLCTFILAIQVAGCQTQFEIIPWTGN